MKNFEKYADEILKIVKANKSFAFNKDGKVSTCSGISCDDCKFNTGGFNCGRHRIEWLYEEAEKTKEDVLEEIYNAYLVICNQQNCDDCPYRKERLKASCEMAFMYEYLNKEENKE